MDDVDDAAAAVNSTDGPRAVAHWYRWWGSRDLVLRVMRASRDALVDASDQNVRVEAHVLVGEDEEHFTGISDFSHSVTDESLRRCHGLRLFASGNQFRVYVPVDIREAGRRTLHVGLWDPQWKIRPKYPLRTSTGHLGVDLWVDRWDAASDDRLVAIRDRIAAAIDRGVPRFGERGKREELSPEEDLRTVLRGPDDWITLLVLAVRDGPMLLLMILSLALSHATDFANWMTLGALAVGARPILFWFGIRTLGALTPPVELREQSRRRHLKRVAGILATAVLSALLGAIAAAVSRAV